MKKRLSSPNYILYAVLYNRQCCIVIIAVAVTVILSGNCRRVAVGRSALNQRVVQNEISLQAACRPPGAKEEHRIINSARDSRGIAIKTWEVRESITNVKREYSGRRTHDRLK